MKILYFIGIVAVMVACLFLVYRLATRAEAKAWNGGYCPICGKKLRHFDDDSQGGHGWCCDVCNYTTWVSYHKMVYRTARKEEVPKGGFTPFESKLKEIIDSYNDGGAITHQGVIYYADQLRKELYK